MKVFSYSKVWVETKRGRVPFFAYVTERIVEGVVEANMGGGGPLQSKEWKEANVNVLTDPENRDGDLRIPGVQSVAM